MPRICFEDLEEGTVDTFGPRAITREEIIAYASEYDPQPMHLDEEAARHTMLGGLAASGWHTCSFLMRMMYDGYLKDSSAAGSPGVEETRWLKPVRPGTQLTLRRSILDKRVSRSRPGFGVVRFRWELLDEAGVTLTEVTCPILFGLREGGGQ